MLLAVAVFSTCPSYLPSLLSRPKDFLLWTTSSSSDVDLRDVERPSNNADSSIASGGGSVG